MMRRLNLSARPSTALKTRFPALPPTPQLFRRMDECTLHKLTTPGKYRAIQYRSRAHNTIIGANGAIRIETIGFQKTVILEKLGANGEGLAI